VAGLEGRVIRPASFYSTERDQRTPPTPPQETKKEGKDNQTTVDKKEEIPKLLTNFQPSQLSAENIKVVKENIRLATENVQATLNLTREKLLALYQDKKQDVDTEWYSQRVSFWMKRYENFVGLTEVKEAQVKVQLKEKEFVDSQENRRATQKSINDIQQTLKSLYDELERTHRGQDKYLELVTQEHHVLQEQAALIEKLNLHEREEREAFSKLSKAVRNSHESERAQAEKTKYWSVLGSVIGTCLGILGTTINNRLRMRELRNLVNDAIAVNKSTPIASTASAAASVALPSPPEESKPVVQSQIDDQEEKVNNAIIESFEKLSESITHVENSTLESIEKVSNTLSDIKKAVAEVDRKQPESNNMINSPSNNVLFSQHYEDLTKVMKSQQDSLENLIKNMKIQIDSKDVRDLQTQVKQIAMKESDHRRDSYKALETLNRNASTALESFEKRVLDIEEMVKDIRSLLLAQAMQLQTSSAAAKQTAAKQEQQLAAASAAAASAAAAKVAAVTSESLPAPTTTNEQLHEITDTFEDSLERSHLTIVGTVENALRDHEERLNSAMVLNSVFVALLTPVIAYAVMRCLP